MRIENPRVWGSIPSLATILSLYRHFGSHLGHTATKNGNLQKIKRSLAGANPQSSIRFNFQSVMPQSRRLVVGKENDTRVLSEMEARTSKQSELSRHTQILNWRETNFLASELNFVREASLRIKRVRLSGWEKVLLK